MGFGFGGVGGRGTGPRDGANFATCVVFLTLVQIPLPQRLRGEDKTASSGAT